MNLDSHPTLQKNLTWILSFWNTRLGSEPPEKVEMDPSRPKNWIRILPSRKTGYKSETLRKKWIRIRPFRRTGYGFDLPGKQDTILIRPFRKTGLGSDPLEKRDTDPSRQKNRIGIRPFRKTGYESYHPEKLDTNPRPSGKSGQGSDPSEKLDTNPTIQKKKLNTESTFHKNRIRILTSRKTRYESETLQKNCNRPSRKEGYGSKQGTKFKYFFV